MLSVHHQMYVIFTSVRHHGHVPWRSNSILYCTQQ